MFRVRDSRPAGAAVALAYGRSKLRSDDPDLYNITYSEIEFDDRDGVEIRRINVFADGDIRYAFDELRDGIWYEISSGRRTHLADQPYYRSDFTDSGDARFAVKAAFHRLWNVALRKHPVAWRTPLYGATKPHPDSDRATFSVEAWRRNAGLIHVARTSPFAREIADGSVSRARFLRELIQYALRLAAVEHCLALAEAKAPSPRRAEKTCRARLAVADERARRDDLLREFNVPSDAFAAMKMAPTSRAHADFLLATAHEQSFDISIASLLPCIWIYGELGREIRERAAPDNPYRLWIDRFGGVNFSSASHSLIDIVDAAADDDIAAMHEAFTLSARYLSMMWDGAYELER